MLKRLRSRIAPVLVLTCLAVAAAQLASHAAAAAWKQVHPQWEDAYVFSFRSPDLLTEDPDEQWGRLDGRLDAGGILSDFPEWLEMHRERIRDARKDDRPIMLAIHTHGGYGTGLVTYTPDLKRAEVANYPWLIRTLNEAGLNKPDVTVTVDTCNSHATAAHQVRPDLVPQGIAAWPPFAQWRRAHPARQALKVGDAYRLFAQDRVRQELAPAARASRANVDAIPFEPLTRGERERFRAKLYGPKGVIFATPAFFNVLRLGPEPKGTLTSNLLTARLDRRLYDSFLVENKAELRKFKEYTFLAKAGPGPVLSQEEVERLERMARDNKASASREHRIERGGEGGPRD